MREIALLSTARPKASLPSRSCSGPRARDVTMLSETPVAPLERPVAAGSARDAAAGAADLGRVRAGRIALVADVGVLHPVERRHGVGPRQGSHAPGADRSADQFDGMDVAEPLPQQQAIERQQGESLGSAGRGRNAADVAPRQAVFTDVADRAGSGTQDEGVWKGSHAARDARACRHSLS